MNSRELLVQELTKLDIKTGFLIHQEGNRIVLSLRALTPQIYNTILNCKLDIDRELIAPMTAENDHHGQTLKIRLREFEN